jgi:hypothetical protein
MASRARSTQERLSLSLAGLDEDGGWQRGPLHHVSDHLLERVVGTWWREWEGLWRIAVGRVKRRGAIGGGFARREEQCGRSRKGRGATGGGVARGGEQ